MFLSGLIQQSTQAPRGTAVTQSCQQKNNIKSVTRPVKTAPTGDVIPQTKLMLEDFYINMRTLVLDLRKIKTLACN